MIHSLSYKFFDKVNIGTGCGGGLNLVNMHNGMYNSTKVENPYQKVRILECKSDKYQTLKEKMLTK